MKTCSICGVVKDRTHFNSKRSECRLCSKIRKSIMRQEAREYVVSKKSQPCQDCGISYHPFVMDFDHRESETKLGNVADMASRYHIDTLKSEIDKCDIVCSNCHRQRTWTRLQEKEL